MNYARLSLEELVMQQEQHLRELTEALLNGQRAHQWMKSALIEKRQDEAIASLGKNKPGCIIFTRFDDVPHRVIAALEKQEKEYQARREMMALLARVGDKYELL